MFCLNKSMNSQLRIAFVYCDFIVSEAFRSKGVKSYLMNCDLYCCDLRLLWFSPILILIPIICLKNKTFVFFSCTNKCVEWLRVVSCCVIVHLYSRLFMSVG